MLKKLPAISLLAVVASTTPAAADPPPWAPAHGWRAKHVERDSDFDRDDAPREPRTVGYDAVIYRGHDGRYYCHRSDGTMGLIVGAAIGGAIGNRLAPGKSATLGTLLGAGAGAVIGEQLDEGSIHCE